jgi:D-alanyl-D-alanine carboxypeptidase
MASLSVGGVDGTLRHRFLTEPGRVLGKTGTINSTRGLVGYVLDASGRPAYAFSILVNDYRCSESAVLDAIDDFARALVEAAGSAAS